MIRERQAAMRFFLSFQELGLELVQFLCVQRLSVKVRARNRIT